MRPSSLLASCVFVVFSSVVVAACDDGDAPPPAASANDFGAAATFDGLVVAASAEACDRTVLPCCSGADAAVRDQCLTQSEASFRSGYQRSGVYSPAAGKACLEAIAASGCARVGGDAVKAACMALFVQASGPKQPGETCAVEADCAVPTGARMDCLACAVAPGSGATCESKCTGRLPADVGEKCVFDLASYDDPIFFRECKPGLACTPQQICRVAPKAGEACDSTCVAGALCAQGTCRALPGPGSACGSAADCNGTACENGACAAPTCASLLSPSPG